MEAKLGIKKLRQYHQITFWIFLTLNLILHIGLFGARNLFNVGNYPGGLEQENFLEYVQSLKSGNFPDDLLHEDTRLFPGLPLLIFLLSFILKSEVGAGLIISLIGLLITFGVVWYFTKQPIFSLWVTVFPPIVLEQTSKISTEALVIALYMLIFFYLSKKKYLFASLLCGYATIVRPISLSLFLALLIFLIKNDERNAVVQCLVAYSISPFFLAFFNIYHWGQSALFYQIPVNMAVGRVAPGFLQWFKDIFRTIAWRQWRILFSGVLYTIFAFFVLIKTLKTKGTFFFKNDDFFVKSWSLLSIIFIFILGPTPFLEELRRYLAVFFPLALLANFHYFYNKKIFFYLSFLMIFWVIF